MDALNHSNKAAELDKAFSSGISINTRLWADLKSQEGTTKGVIISPLTYAIRDNNFDLVSFLVDKGVDLNAYACTTPLNLAIELVNEKKIDPTMIDTLIDYGADATYPDSSANTPLVCALGLHNEELVKKLVKKGAVEFRGGAITPLGLCVQNDDKKMFDYLVSEKIDVNARDLCGRTALTIAIQLDNDHFVKRLLESGVKTANEYEFARGQGKFKIAYMIRDHESVVNGIY
ncbi:hypothetical protein Noda2021_00970 [Candidatus Dependentiae bacterium Noda2021]|nr:hypothetical protein Noda2021_00970 [Candidatus Dependentiae bacterium Noda2021]